MQAVIFDLDDTLYAERDFVLSGFRAVDSWLQSELAISGFAEAARRHFDSARRGRIFDAALADLGVADPARLVPQLVAVYRAHSPQLALLPDAERALRHLRPRSRLGLLTDGYAATQRNKVAALGLAPWFDALVFTDDLGREHWKPSPVPFRRMMALLGVPAPECVYVADNPLKDFAAPNELGWRTVQVRHRAAEYARQVPPTAAHVPGVVLQNLDELASFLA